MYSYEERLRTVKLYIKYDHSFSARASFIIRGNYQSGKVLRRSGGKSPASWQEKSVQVAESLRFMQIFDILYLSHS